MRGPTERNSSHREPLPFRQCPILNALHAAPRHARVARARAARARHAALAPAWDGWPAWPDDRPVPAHSCVRASRAAQRARHRCPADTTCAEQARPCAARVRSCAAQVHSCVEQAHSRAAPVHSCAEQAHSCVRGRHRAGDSPAAAVLLRACAAAPPRHGWRVVRMTQRGGRLHAAWLRSGGARRHPSFAVAVSALRVHRAERTPSRAPRLPAHVAPPRWLRLPPPLGRAERQARHAQP